MSSQIAAIAEAVKTSLNAASVAGTFSPHTFTARRIYVPLQQLEGLDTLTVLVVPQRRDLSKSARNRALARDVIIDVGILKKLSVDPTAEAANATIDSLLELAEKIADHYSAGSTAGDGQWFETANPALYDIEKLLNARTFLTVVTFTFKIL